MPMPEEEEETKAQSTGAASGRRRKQEKTQQNEEKTKLSVPNTQSRSLSPAKKDKTQDLILTAAAEKGKGRPKWIKESDIGVFTEHRDIVNCIAWNSKNPDLLASASNDSTARFWELRPSEEKGANGLVLSSNKATLMSHKSIDGRRKAITALSWHPDGTLLATAAGDGVGRMFTPNGALEGILAYGRGGINAIKFSPNGSMVLTATNERVVNLFNVTAGPAMKSSYDAHTGTSSHIIILDQ